MGEQAIDVEAIIAIPNEVRKQFGWTGAKLRGAVKIIEERLRDHLRPPVDPDLIEARAVAAKFSNNRPGVADRILDGEHDDSEAVAAILAAIKRGRELSRSTNGASA